MSMSCTVMYMFRCIGGVELFLGGVVLMIGMYAAIVMGMRPVFGFLAASGKQE